MAPKRPLDIAEIRSEDEFFRIVSPTLVPKPAKKGNDKTGLYVPIDGTIGSVMHNINAWLTTDSRGAEILRRNGLSRFLAYLDAPRDGFAPVKSVWDQYMQANTDAYRIDLKQRSMVADPRFQFPEVEIQSMGADKKDDGYWSEYQTMIDSFGRLRIVELKGFYLNGQVMLRDAVLRGIVKIENHTDALADLHDVKYRTQLEEAGLFHDGVLVIENKTIHIYADQLTIESASPKNGSNPIPKSNGSPRATSLSLFKQTQKWLQGVLSIALVVIELSPFSNWVFINLEGHRFPSVLRDTSRLFSSA